MTAPENSPEQKNHRWFLTPERFICIMLAVEIILWLSERYRWFPFNEKKGLTVLIAIALLGLSLLWFFLWFLSAWFYRRRFQFGIRTLLVLMIAVAVPFSWVAVRIEKAKREKEITRNLQNKRNCTLVFYEELGPPAWLENILGDCFFKELHSVCTVAYEFSDEDLKQCCQLDDWVDFCSFVRCSITDAGLENIAKLTRLKHLDLTDTPITDAGLKHLERLHRLEMLSLVGTNVTEAGVQQLQAKLPHCKISL
jgi:hypothetical protein